MVDIKKFTDVDLYGLLGVETTATSIEVSEKRAIQKQ